MRREVVQRLAQQQKIGSVLLGRGKVEARDIGADFFELATVSNRVFAPRILNQNTPHSLRGGGEEMRAILPLWLGVTTEPQPYLMHERGGLQRLFRWLARHFRRGEFAQFVIDERQDLVGGLRIALLGALEQKRDIARIHAFTMARCGVGEQGKSRSDAGM